MTIAETARRLDLKYRTVRDWINKPMPTDDPAHRFNAHQCPRCSTPRRLPPVPEAYGYLLGQYLGDGYLCTKYRVPVLRIACADKYPGVMSETRTACLATMANKVQLVQKVGCTWVQSFSMHWPCLFPQHGPGVKHTRPIRLHDWQLEVVERYPEPFVRGLIHSDGCRVVNHTTVKGKRYEYPRYHFTNMSADILGLCAWGFELLGVEWRMNNYKNLSVARRESVAVLDSFIGVKT